MKLRLMLASSKESNAVFCDGSTAFKTGHPLLVEVAVGGLHAGVILSGCSNLYSDVVKTRALLSLWEAQDAPEKNRKTGLPQESAQTRSHPQVKCAVLEALCSCDWEVSCPPG